MSSFRLNKPTAPVAPAPPAPDHAAELAELLRWRMAFPNQSPMNVVLHIAALQGRIEELEAPKVEPVKAKAKAKKAKSK